MKRDYTDKIYLTGDLVRHEDAKGKYRYMEGNTMCSREMNCFSDKSLSPLEVRKSIA